MIRRKRLLFFVCFLPILLCLSYLFCVYSVYKRNTQRIYEYELHRLDLPIWLNNQHSPQSLNFNGHDSSQVERLKFKKHVFSRPLNDNHYYGNNNFRNRLKQRLSGKEKSFIVKGDILANEGEYLGGFRTDVDRSEDRKKKKKREKFKKGLKEKCIKDITACQELKIIEEEEKRKYEFQNGVSSIGLRLHSSNKNDSNKYLEWSSYADKGFTIVGQQGSLLKRLPHVLIIGAKKAGTRALLEFLRLHPSVTAAGAELHFFDRFFHRGPAWYRNNLPPSLEGQLTVEKTPAYFVDREVPERVKEFLPSVRLLLVVRDPVIRAVSDFTQSLSKHDARGTFKEFVLKNATSGLVNVGWGPVRGGLYARHYQRWRKYFPSSSIHVVSGETLVSDPAQEMAAVQEFLNIEKVINDRHFYFNATKGFPCLVKREKNGRPHCLGYSKGRLHPQVDEDTLQILRDFYRPFNAKFYKLVGRNFGWA